MLSFGGSLVAGAATVVQLAAVADLVSDTTRGGVAGDLLGTAIALALATIVVQLTGTAQTEHALLLTQLLTRSGLVSLLRAADSVELAEYERSDFHDHLQRATSSAAIRPFQMVSGLVSLSRGAIASIGVVLYTVSIQPILPVVVFLAVLPSVALHQRVARERYDFAAARTEVERQRRYLEGLLVDRDAAKELRAFGLSRPLRGRYEALYEAFLKDLRAHLARRVRIQLIANVISATALLLGMAAYLWWAAGDLSPEGLAVGIGSAVLLYGRFRESARGVSGLYETALFLDDFQSFLDRCRPADATEASPLEPLDKVGARDVLFGYPGGSKAALRGVSLEIRRGQIVALVGENGSGKTTLVKILAGLYTPLSGTVAWNGEAIPPTHRESLRDRVSVLFQDFGRYEMMARENITFGRWEERDDQARLVAASESAQAHGFISALSQGFETVLSPRFAGGVDLSTGQWQRVALARAAFRDADLLILDEPTASLDPRAEREVFRELRSWSRDKCTLLVSHRFSTVRSADYIYVLVGGRIAEHGTHAELLRARGVYAEMFEVEELAATAGTPASDDGSTPVSSP